MIKRMNKITSLLVAAAAMASIVPATGVNAAERLETKEGTIQSAVAFNGGNYLYEGYKSDDSDQGIYYNNNKEDKLLKDIEDADMKGEYSDKYAFTLDGKDQYLVDLSTGDVIDDKTPEDNADTAATKLKTALKKTDRYGKVEVTSADLGYDEAADKTGVLAGNKFGETWYEYSIAPIAGADGEDNTVDAKLYGFTNGEGKYIDASHVANLYAYSTEKNKMVKISEFSNNADDIDEDTGLLATLVEAPKVLTQDKNYIYAMVTVNITDENDAAIMSGTTTGAAVTGLEGKTVTKRTYIQKISKAQGEQVDGAYVPKTVESYELLGANDQLDSDDSKDARVAIENADEVTIVGSQLLAIEVNDANDNVKVTSIDLKKEKLEYVSGSAQAAVKTGEVDAYVAEKNDSDDIDADNASLAYDVDVNGNVWVVADGNISKFANNKFEDVYKVDSSLDSLNAYDENNLIAWKADGDIYTTIGGTKTTEPTTETPVVTPVATAGWVQAADGTWTYNKADGTKTIGWLNDNGTWYYLKADGIMATGWVKDGSTWYFLNASGAMKTGWIKDGSTWYYLNGSGAMQTGWINDNGTWYYLNTSGAMLASTVVDGYVLGASGAWVK